MRHARMPARAPAHTPRAHSLVRWVGLCAVLILTGCASTRPDEAVAPVTGPATPGLRFETPPADPGSLALATDLAIERDRSALRPLIVSGDPRLTRRARPRLAGADDTRTITLNFENIAIREVAGVILGDLLGVNYAVDPDVDGQANLKSTEPVPVSAALGILETILKQNDAALVVDGDLYRVVPADQAPVLAPSPSLGSDSRPIPPGYSVRVVPLRFIAASEMAEILEPFAGDGGVLRIDETRNLLVLAGMSRDLALWLETVDTFDVDWFAGKSVGIFPISDTAAETVMEELQAIFGESGEEAGGVIEFLPIERLNAVMAISPAPALIDRVGAWVIRLDKGSPAGRQLHVYRMKHAKAADLAPMLQDIFAVPAAGAVRAAAAGTMARSTLAPGLTPTTVMAGSSPASMANRTRTMAAAPGGGSMGGAASGPAPAADIRIMANESMNALLILATTAEYRLVESALRKLDVPPLQVLVEATVAEVTITEDLRYGVQYFLEGTIFQEEFTATLSNAASGALASTFPGFSFVTGAPVRSVLDALEGVTRVNVISSPNLMVMDNQKAALVVGDEVPVAVQAQENALTDDDVIVNTIEFRNTGVIFEVTPRVNFGGTISLEISQEASTVAASATPTLTPTISQRKITSTVSVDSGETIILGGLFSENMNKSRSGLPFIARIPVIGWLFGSSRDMVTRTELVVLISPRVVRNLAESRQITAEMRERLRRLDAFSDRGRAQIGTGY